MIPETLSKQLLKNKKRQIIRLGLDRIKAHLTNLGNPQDNFKSVLIGGTNGKGSTTFYLSNLACKLTGYKIGRYTSPHLTSWNERFVINENTVEQHLLDKISERVVNKIDSFELKNSQYGRLTEFEIYTIIAFELFASQKVDIAFLEVGMGGRLDATNITSDKNTLCSVITNISLDHTQYLGESIEKIAYEKAGIIKKENHIITGANEPALSVIRAKASELKSVLLNMDLEKFDSYQDKNISLSLKAWETISKQIKTNKSETNKTDFLKRLQFPGRFHYLKEHNILLDGAHNPASAGELKKLITKHFPEKKVVYIIGILDKDYKGFINNLIPQNSSVICTEPVSTRATKKEALADCILRNSGSAILADNLTLAIKKARSLKHDLIVITGSLYLVGEALELVQNKQLSEIALK